MKKTSSPQSLLVLLVASALLSSALPAGLHAQSQTDQKISLMADAIRARDSGDLARAKVKLEELLKLAPNDAQTKQFLEEVNAALAVSLAPAAQRKADAEVKTAAVKAADTAHKDEAAAADARKTAAAQAAAGKFDEAAATFDAAIKSLPDSFTADLQKDKTDLLVQQARSLTKEGKFTEARKALADYRQAPGSSAKVADETDAAIDNASIHNVPVPTIKEVSPAYVAQEMKIAPILATGRAQYNAGDYEDAEVTFNQVLRIDPINAEAVYFRGKIQEQLVTVNKKKADLTIATLLAQSSGKWVLPEPKEENKEDAHATQIVTSTALSKTMDRIQIPGGVINFNNVDIESVIQALSQLSVQYFPKDLDEPPGVNMRMGGLDQNSPRPTVNIKVVTALSLTRIMEEVTAQIGYRFDVGNDFVTVHPGGGGSVLGGNLDFDTFPINSAAKSKMLGAGGGGGGAAAADPFDASTGDAAPAANAGGGDSAALQSFLENAGVSFSGVPGSKLAYDGTAILVTQTSDNLTKIKNIISRYNDVRQVTIEAKFIEVQQGLLEEAGINWNVGRNNDLFSTSLRSTNAAFATGVSGSNSGAVIIPASPASFTVSTVTIGTTPTSITTSIPAVAATNITTALPPPTIPGSVDLGADAANLLNIAHFIGSIDVQAMVRAMQRDTTTELLSAPTVTVLTGNQANITVAQEIRYPQSYGEPRSQASQGGSVSVTPGTPQEFTTRNVGVELTVTPTVDDDDYTIALDLDPKVTEFEGFVEYGGLSVAISGGSPPATVTVPSGFYQPIFSVREVKTKVTVWDGATLVLGGLTREEVQKVTDKVPVLGDIPYLGKLFQSKGESTQKRNLMIFVTANLVNPGGGLKAQDIKNVKRNTLYQNIKVAVPSGEGVRVGPSSK